MLRVQIVLVLIAGLMAGCGQVSVFGHTIGEKQPASEAKSDSNAPHAAAATPSDQTPREQIPRDQATKDQAPRAQKVKSVTLVLTPQATAKVVDDSRFNADALLAAIKTEFQSRKLLDDTDSHASTAEISLDNYAMQPTSNVILFGNIISNGKLGGTIKLRDPQGNDLPNRRIDAEARVSIPANGETTNPLGPLYRQFAVMTGDLLTGTQAKPDATDQRPR